MDKFNEMGKVELRAACKEAGISYGKLNNDGMRDALRAAEAPVVTLSDTDKKQIEDEANARQDAQLVDECGFSHCPHCKIHLTNGFAHYDDICDSNKKAAGEMVREWVCLGCNGEWGNEVVHSTDRHTGTGLKIEKNREEKNGVKRPSIGGKCRAIWDALDALASDPDLEGAPVIASMVRELAADEGWNPNNASIEFYQWRKFNGITGRAK